MAVAPEIRKIRQKPLRRIEYPSSDGKPMAETDLHRDLAVYVIEALQEHFAARPQVYIAGNNFIYYREGDPRKCVSPDAYVVLGAGMRRRDSYKVWEEGDQLPEVVFEFTSRKTRLEDDRKKRPLYLETLRLPEYFLFDPTGDYLTPRLQGYRLDGDRYTHLLPENNRLHSEVLGLDLVQEDTWLWVYDPEKRYLNRRELESRAEQEAMRAARAEDEVARLRAELEALRRRAES